MSFNMRESAERMGWLVVAGIALSLHSAAGSENDPDYYRTGTLADVTETHGRRVARWKAQHETYRRLLEHVGR